MRSPQAFAYEGMRLAARFLGIPFVLTNDFGLKMVVYPANRMPTWKLKGRYHNRKEFAAFELLVPKEGVVADIGAHFGMHAMMMARRAKKVYAFEPTPRTYDVLLKNIDLNGVKNIVPLRYALADKPGMLKMNLFEEHESELNSLHMPDTDAALVGVAEVKVTTLDEFARGEAISRFDFVKIDAEGFEREVLLGASGLLKQGCIRSFSFEMAQNQFDGIDRKPSEVYQIIQSFGYSICSFDGKNFSKQDGNHMPTHDNLYAFSADFIRETPQVSIL